MLLHNKNYTLSQGSNMKNICLLSLPALVSLLLNGAAPAQEKLGPPTLAPVGPEAEVVQSNKLTGLVPHIHAQPPIAHVAPDGNCCPQQSRCGLFFDFEATFFRYYRADGRRNGTGPESDDGVRENDLNFAPRFTLGWMMAPGLGVRARYWEYEETWLAAEGGISTLGVDTKVFDVEIFKQLRYNDGFSLELSGGFRWNEFDETMNDNGGIRSNHFRGSGLVAGLSARQMLASWASIYGTSRLALLLGDKTRANVTSGNETLYDTPTGMLELGLGIECGYKFCNGSRIYSRLGGEVQRWFNYSSNFDGTDENSWTGSSDVGFVGLVAGIGIDF